MTPNRNTETIEEVRVIVSDTDAMTNIVKAQQIQSVQMSIELHMNPYTPSPLAAEELLLSNDCPQRGLLRRTRWPRGVLAVLALVYFLSCLIAWSRYWYTGYFVPGTLRDYAMFCVAATLVVSSTGTLYGLFRNRRRISTVFTLVMFLGLSAFALCCAL